MTQATYRCSSSPAFRPTRAARSVAVPTPVLAPPSQEMVAAVAELGDVVEEREDGLVSRRFSREALERGLASLVLTREADRLRALDLQVVWNEAEGEIVAVVDLGPLRTVRESADQINRYASARLRHGAAADFSPSAQAA